MPRAVSGHGNEHRAMRQVLTVLSGVAQSAYKMCGDVRLLANLKEVEEPFAKTQVCDCLVGRTTSHSDRKP